MKKLAVLISGAFLLMNTAFAGGILTNTNQSAQFVRMLSRNASTDLDAVYFNPAGLTQLQNGFYFGLHNQTITQTKKVDSKFPWLNDGYYEGDVKVPVFPSAFAVYKLDNWAFSAGFGPNGGGGSATFDRGLPSFEIPLTKLVPGLAGLQQLPAPLNYNISAYDADLSFDGSSVFWGIQIGATYKVNKVVSGYLGVRYLPAVNTYSGYIRDIQLNVNGQMQPAKSWLSTLSGNISALATQASTASTQLSGTATKLQQVVDGGGGSLTLAELQEAGMISQTERLQIEGGLQSFGYSPSQISTINVLTTKTSFSTAATQYAGQAAVLTGTANNLSGTAAGLADKNVDTQQNGAGWTPIIGANFNISEQLNIGLRFEYKTQLVLTNKTKVDDLGLFPDGGKSRNDLPSILAIGVGYKPVKWLDTQLSYNLFFDKGVDWGYNTRDLAIYKNLDQTKIRHREIEHNYWELALGLQFNLSDKFAVSVGGMKSASGIADSYQSDFSFSNPSVTGALGIQWKVNDRLTFDAGALNTFYKDATVSFTDPDAGTYKETLGKTTFDFAFGIGYKIF